LGDVFRYGTWFNAYAGGGDLFMVQVNSSNGSTILGYQDGSSSQDVIYSLKSYKDRIYFAGFWFDVVVESFSLNI